MMFFTRGYQDTVSSVVKVKVESKKIYLKNDKKNLNFNFS